MSNTGIVIGGPNQESVKALKESIMDILNAPYADQKTKQLALKVMTHGVKAPTHTSISNVHMVVGQEQPKEEEEEIEQEGDEQ